MSLATYYAPSVGSPGLSGFDRWFRETDETRMAQAMVATAQQIERDQSLRFEEHLIYASFHAGKELTSLYQFTGAPNSGAGGIEVMGHRVSFNVVQSCINTAGAKIAKNKARVMFLTSDGNHNQKMRAKKLTRYTDGLFYECDFYEAVSQPVFRDACLFDGGVAQVMLDPFDAKVTAERVLPFEILVDEQEAIYGKPRSLYRRKFYPRDVLTEWLGRKDPEKRARIKDAPGVDPTRVSGRASDMVAVYEGWHLPPGSDGKGGHHVIAIESGCLERQDWKRQYFPFPKFTWEDGISGWWGLGIAHRLVGHQLELNKLLRTIQQAMHLTSVPRWSVANGATVSVEHISNEIGSIVKSTGDKPPQPFVAQAMHPEVYQHVERIYRNAFEDVGVSMMDATAVKPAGLNSAPAQREYHDIASERFVLAGQRFEAFHLESARQMIDLSREAYEKNRSLRVKAPGTKLLEQIDWKDVNLDEDSYVMKPFPTSILPTTPAGRLEKLEELVQAGWIPREYAMAAMDMPDLESYVSLQTAATMDVERIIGKIIDEGRYETPEPHMDLALAQRMTQSAYLKARSEDVPEKRLELLLRFLEECDYLAQELAPQPAAPGAPGSPLPPAMPAPAASLGPPESMGLAPPMPTPLPMEAGSMAVPSALPAGVPA